MMTFSFVLWEGQNGVNWPILPASEQVSSLGGWNNFISPWLDQTVPVFSTYAGNVTKNHGKTHKRQKCQLQVQQIIACSFYISISCSSQRTFWNFQNNSIIWIWVLFISCFGRRVRILNENEDPKSEYGIVANQQQSCWRMNFYASLLS